MRLAMSEFTTYRWTFEDDVRHYAHAGFDGIGVCRHKLSECGEELGVDLLCESRLEVSSLMWAGGFTGSDGRSVEAAIEDGIEALRLAAALRADCLVAYTGGRGGHTHRHSNRIAANALAELVAVGGEIDVQVAIEPMHPGCGLDWTFLSSIDRTLDFISQVPGLKMVFDAYHWASSPSILDEMDSFVDQIALVQVGDSCGRPCGEQDRRPIGKGKLPLVDVVGRLADLGYEGFVEVELMGPEIEVADYHRLVHESLMALSDLTAGVKQ